MIQISKTEICGLEPALRGMRNPMESWERSDSEPCVTSALVEHCKECPYIKHCNADESGMYNNIIVAPNDRQLCMKLANGGPCHAKYRRFIIVYCDILAPLYWWKEFDTYKVGTVSNSTSTMHKIHEKEFTVDDFSHEHLIGFWETPLRETIEMLNKTRELYLETEKMDKELWYRMIQILPSSYNQLRTVKMNYEVLANIYKYRRDHKLDEWRDFCKWIEELPYSQFITLKSENKKEE